MTVNYKGNLFLSLFHWKGSVWKAIWVELLIWLATFYFIRVLLHEILREEDVDSVAINKVINLFTDYTNRLPLEFLLSFYVNQAVNRWWAQVRKDE